MEIKINKEIRDYSESIFLDCQQDSSFFLPLLVVWQYYYFFY